MKERCCREWDEGIVQLNNMLTLNGIRSASPPYTAPPFKWCPWCGDKILDEDEEIEA